jgi:hypothetical protein
MQENLMPRANNKPQKINGFFAKSRVRGQVQANNGHAALQVCLAENKHVGLDVLDLPRRRNAPTVGRSDESHSFQLVSKV